MKDSSTYGLAEERIRRQSPILWLAVPGALGMACAGTLGGAGNFALPFLVAATLSAAFCINAMLFDRMRAAKAAFVVFAFCAGAFRYVSCAPENPYPDWNAREAPLGLRIERADTNAKGACYGFARVEEAPRYFEKAVGMRLWFYVKDSPDISRGDRVDGVFVIRKVGSGEGFDAYLNSQKVHFTLSAQKAGSVRKGGFPYSLYNAARAYMRERLSEFPDPALAQSQGAKAYRAMILGDKAELGAGAKKSFADTGTMHIFAISGLHVGLVAAAVYGLLNLFRLPRKIQPLLCLPVLFLYVNACGARPSAMRAFAMIALIWIASSLLRKPKPLAGLGAAFCLSLALRPTDLFDAGFALSYSVVAAILLYAVPLYGAIKAKMDGSAGPGLEPPGFFRKIADGAAAAFAISFAALCMSAPLSSAYFGYVAPLSLPFSIVYVAAAGAVLSLGLAAMALPFAVAEHTNRAAAFITSLMLDGAAAGSESGLVIGVKIPGAAAFLIESALLCVLLIGYRIPGAWKWAAFPALSAAGILFASIAG